jgi:hypothetical protein
MNFAPIEEAAPRRWLLLAIDPAELDGAPLFKEIYERLAA